MKRLLHGALCLRRGFTLIRQPGLRRYALVPLLINIVVYVLVVWLLLAKFSGWLEDAPLVSNWQDVWLVRWLLNALQFLLGAGLLLISLYTFTLLANLIGAPFNGLLAEKVEARLRGQPLTADHSWGAIIKSVPLAMLSELRKWLYVLLWLIPIGILHLIPGVQLIAPFVLMLFGAWVFAIEYLDYPMGNHGHGFGQVRKTARQHRLDALGFGAAAALMTLIPLASLIVMPVAVAGATALYVDTQP